MPDEWGGAGDLAERLDRVSAAIRAEFEAQHQAREVGLKACRKVIQFSANAIRAIHRHEYEAAERLLADAATAAQEVHAVLRAHPPIYYAGFVHDAVKEYAEGRITLALVTGAPLPTPADLGVEAAAYLNGLAEAAGELRRFALDALRRADYARADALLTGMDEIYAVLVTIDFPDAITRGLRRTTDMVRGVTEKTRGDLTVAAMQRELQGEMQALRARLDRAAGPPARD